MPNADFFTRFGMFIVKDFFDAELCARLRAEARPNTDVKATVYKGAPVLDENARKTKHAKVSAETTSLIEERILALKPALESHFNVTLTGCQTPQVLAYREGDFFQPHRDNSYSPGYLESIKNRQVSIVIFLSSETNEPGPDSYSGGSLVFYGLVDDPRCKAIGFPLIGETGLFVAFRSNTFHEVKPVINGERYTIVTWLF